jgi:uncharacterized protein with HEPN domain
MPHDPEKYLYDILVHGYDSLDHDIVWNVIENKLSILRREIEALLKELEEKN